MVISLPSYAKINACLRILGKRPDGFHEIRTWMLPISLSDGMTFEELNGTSIEITCSDPNLPTDGGNLVRKAALLLQSKYGVKKGCRIDLQKQIPIGAGLGGGSSNGSTTLVGLNRLWNLNLKMEVLEQLAAEFGSDTAFFVRNRSALSEGRGERLTPVVHSKAVPIFLMNFKFGSATAWAYRNLHAPLLPSPSAVTPIDPATFEGDLSRILTNDLERPVFKKFPILQGAKEFLQSQAGVKGAMMCGSGSTMMAVLQSLDAGSNLTQKVKQAYGSSLWTWSGSTIPS